MNVMGRIKRQLMRKRPRLPIRVIIVENLSFVRIGIRTVLELDGEVTVVGNAGTWVKALLLVNQHHLDIVLMDIRLPDTNGVRACREIRRLYPNVRVIFFTTVNEPDLVREALAAGGHGYVLKQSPCRHIPLAVKAVARNQFYLDDEITRHAVDWLNEPVVGT